MAKRRTSSSASQRSSRTRQIQTAVALAVERFLFVGGMVLLVCLVWYGRVSRQDPEETLVVVPPDYSVLAASMTEAIEEALVGLGIQSDWIAKPRTRRSGSMIHIQTRVRVPANLPLCLCNLEVSRAVERMGGSIVEGSEDGQGNVVTLKINLRNSLTGEVILSADGSITRPEGKVALIIDDFGAADDETSLDFLGLHQPFSIAVLPNGRDADKIARQAHKRGIEVLLHLPMEPHDHQIDPGREVICVNMDAGEIQARVRKAIADVPHARGVNNHMGSKATESVTVMEAVLGEIKNHDLFWIDSRTSLNSVAYDLARKAGVKAAQNRMFLDSEPEIEKILGKVERMFQEATMGKGIVAIAHCRPLTLQVLREELPKLEKRGITFVFASDLVE